MGDIFLIAGYVVQVLSTYDVEAACTRILEEALHPATAANARAGHGFLSPMAAKRDLEPYPTDPHGGWLWALVPDLNLRMQGIDRVGAVLPDQKKNPRNSLSLPGFWLELVAGARSTRFLRLVRGAIPRVAA